MNKAVIVDRLSNNISFAIQQGEMVGLLSTNSVDKTTLLRTISGNIKPISGFVSVLDSDPYQKNVNYLKQISFFENNKLWNNITALKSLEIYKDIYNISERNYISMLESLSEIFELKNYLNISIEKLSINIITKLNMIVSLIHNPKLLLIDKISDFNLNYLYEYNKKYNTTILMSSDNINSLVGYFRRVLILDKNRLIYDGSIEELIYKYASNVLIKIIFSGKLDISILKNLGEIRKNNYPEIYLLVPRIDAQLKSIEIMNNFLVSSISIEEVSLDEITKKLIYKK